MYKTWTQEELVVKEVEYFWDGVIPYGFPTFINGSTGLGKTNVMIKVAANATKGLFPPKVMDGQLGQSEKGEPIRCFYASTENPVCEVVYPAFLHNDADETMFKIQKEDGDSHFILCNEDLEAAMDDFSPRIIIIDAFQEHLPQGYTLSDGDAMSELIKEWEAFAYKHKVAFVLIGNDAKGSEGRSDANKMLGSGVISRKARVLITVKESGANRYLKVTKRFGYTKKSDTRIGYRFGWDDKLEFYCYSDEPEIMSAVDFLKNILNKGPMERKELFAAAEKAGFSKTQLYYAREAAGVVYDRFSRNNTIWMLNSEDQ